VETVRIRRAPHRTLRLPALWRFGASLWETRGYPRRKILLDVRWEGGYTLLPEMV